MQKAAQSFGHAIAGLVHAVRTERNILLFLLGYVPTCAIGIAVRLGGLEWTILLIAGGLFLAVELMNTAMERLVDTLDDYQKQLLGSHFHLGLKMAKDVASGASLVSLTIVIAVILIILLPHLTPIVRLLLHA